MSNHLAVPFSGTTQPFRIGLKPLDLADWIEVDERLDFYLAEKHRLAALHFDGVFVAEKDTDTAQAELLSLLTSHLNERHSATHRLSGDVMEIIPANRRVRISSNREPPLWTAAQLVEDDLILMRRSETGWRLVAGSLCFPSSWSLREKFGLPMHEVHAPVPGFGAGTRHAELISRMFDNLRPDSPMIRWNWSIYGDADLHHPESANPSRRRFGDGARADSAFLRVERQTLRKLPVSGDIVFTIGIHVDPFAALAAHDDGPRIAATLAQQVAGLDADQLAYKGLLAEREQLLATLADIVDG